MAEGLALLTMRQTLGDEQVLNCAEELPMEQQLELARRHPNQTRALIESKQND